MAVMPSRDNELHEASAERAGGRATAARGGEVRSTFTMTSLRLTGKVLGLAKTLVIAAWFGASGALDAFWVSYMIPQLMPGLILGVVTLSFIPTFVRSTQQGGKEIDWRGLNTLFTLVGMIVIAIAAAVALFRDPLVTVLAPGLPDDVHALAARLMALMAVAVLLFGINAILSAVMQAMRRFALMSLESIMTNTVIIAGAVLFANTLGVHGLAYAVIAGFGFHMLVLVWANRDLIRDHLRPAFDFSHRDFRAPALHMLPLLVGYFGSIGMTIIDRMFVSTLDAGAISVLVYASMIALLPMEVFGQAVITAFYPTLSRDHASGSVVAMRDAQVRGIRLLLFVLVPTAVGLVLAAQPLVTLLLERGAFSADASRLTAVTLAALAVGLPMRAVNYFNFRVFHSRSEPWLAVSVGLFGICVNVTGNVLLIGPLGVAGIALATSIATAACVVLSSVLLKRRQGFSVARPLLPSLGKLLVMTLVLTGTAVSLFQLIHLLPVEFSRWQLTLLQLGAFIPAGIAFVAAGYLLRFEEVLTLQKYLRRRLLASGAG